jgi:DNA-binding ferritin-like protein (Dps family)
MKNTIFIILILIVIGVGYSVYTSNTNAPLPINTNTQGGNQAPIANPTVQSEELSTLQAGGSSYADPDGVYVFLYPAEYKIDSQEDGKYTRIYKAGATQKGQTEMYDGIIIHFEKVALEGKTLEAWVDTQIQNSTADGTSELIEPKTATTLNTYEGFTYKMRGLGESKYIVVQKDSSSSYALNITMAVNDPEKIGYQVEVDSILATVELLK